MLRNQQEKTCLIKQTHEHYNIMMFFSKEDEQIL